MVKTFKITLERTIKQTCTITEKGFMLVDAIANTNKTLRENKIDFKNLDNYQEEIIAENIIKTQLIKEEK